MFFECPTCKNMLHYKPCPEMTCHWCDYGNTKDKYRDLWRIYRMAHRSYYATDRYGHMRRDVGIDEYRNKWELTNDPMRKLMFEAFYGYELYSMLADERPRLKNTIWRTAHFAVIMRSDRDVRFWADLATKRGLKLAPALVEMADSIDAYWASRHEDYGVDCRNCGKPYSAHAGDDGMCSSCRTIWNS